MSHVIYCYILGLFLVILAYKSVPIEGISFDEYVTLSQNQKSSLDEFKRRVLPDLKHDYMKTDIYLIRYLRNAKFDINKAENALYATLKYRKENNIDSIHDEDFSSLNKEYPYWIEGEDKEGRPLLLLPLEDWDIRKAALSGRRSKLNRYLIKIFDETEFKIRDLQNQGKNVTQYTMILGIGNVNVVQHINPTAFPFWLSGAIHVDTYLRGVADKIILVNSPSIFDIILSLVRPVISSETYNSITPFSKSPDQAKLLFNLIDRKNLPISFGGTKVVN